ncbi:hypothetical protein [Chitinophaga tropicalis]|uniref:Uncharacterized protein n=1 Tax=Chitinophaga tropicalis TaxID=2683588 RepID=A0A7K1TZG1_9BACT|nr:hypothetical protein [Chitinophaga tropicalis]MVT07446.1 hypothetical protein [Chitinophaga tropicalis]
MGTVVNIYDYLLLFVGIVLVNYVYENGYLENDVKTIKQENNPTLRLNTEEISVIDDKFRAIFFIRVLIGVLLTTAYFYLAAFASVKVNAYMFLFVLIALQILYIIYNRVRNLLNLFLILPLSLIRFFGFILPLIPERELGAFITLAVLTYPLSKFFEFSTKERFRKILPWLWNFNIDRFRIIYYLMLTVLLGAGFALKIHQYCRIFFLVSAFYLIYRLVGLLVINNQKILADFGNNFGRDK